MALHLDIVTPEKTHFSGRVSFVYLPGSEGELGILPHHAALVTALKPGELRYGVEGEIEMLAVGGGFVEVADDRVVVMTDMALDEHQIDEVKVEAALERAEKALEDVSHSDNVEKVAALQATIAKSMAQLNLKRKRREGR
jgi:F-type H+-transporting ATPase subunit epsilon